MSSGTVAAIYLAPQGGAPMERVATVHAVAGEGLEGDRYRVANGYWSGSGRDICQITLIRGEDLDAVARGSGVRVNDGEHRRNIVTRGVDFGTLVGRRFVVGEAELEYERPRPPCRYLGTLTQPEITVALRGRSGLCARIVTSGTIREGDPIRLVSAG